MCEGSITASATAADGSVKYELAVAFVSLKLPAGGLSVHGSEYAGTVDIKAGESISWTGKL